MKSRQSPDIKPVPASRESSPDGRFSLITKSTKSKLSASDHLHHLAFNNSFLANIISIVSDGNIVAANRAAGNLLGYSKKILLTKNMKDIFSVSDNNYKLMLKQRRTAGHAMGDLTIIKKDGKQLPCQITSVVFTGDNHVKKAITTLVDRSDNIRKQKDIDLEKEKQTTAETVSAKFKSDASLNRLIDLEHQLDKEITAKERLQSSSRSQQKIFEKQRTEETKLKEIQIADAITEAKNLERSDLGKELHDNVTQLLAASRLYLDIARKNKMHREMYLSRSSEYTLTAIEEIRKLTKGLINDVINNFELGVAVHNIIQDIMEVYPIKINCTIDNEIRSRVNAKFSLNVFRIVQEQLNNIIKHAKASLVNINLAQNNAAITLSISDNGLGFDLKKKAKGIGIVNIKSRAAFYMGTAHFVTQPGRGCALTVTFPAEGLPDKEPVTPN
jgi:PAS domain S-box-containing protein